MVASNVAARLRCHVISHTPTVYYYILSTGRLPRFRTLSFGHNLLKMLCARAYVCVCVYLCGDQRIRKNEQTTIRLYFTTNRITANNAYVEYTDETKKKKRTGNYYDILIFSSHILYGSSYIRFCQCATTSGCTCNSLWCVFKRSIHVCIKIYIFNTIHLCR